MSESNELTIQSYESHVQEYIDGSPKDVSGSMKEWLDGSIAGLPIDARILELGSASGRDAAYLQNLGYTVDCSDAAQSFVELLQQRGFNARKLIAITDDFGGPYELVLANAVLLHFSRDEIRQVLRKVFDSLGEHGRFAFTIKQGEGEAWSENKLGAPRYFCYWTEEQIRLAVNDTGFTDVTVTGDDATANATWLQIIAQKQAPTPLY